VPFARLRFTVLCLICTACGRSAPEPPVVNPPGGTETINGSERLGWDQRAANASDLAAIRYAIYVDGVRSELSGASCEPNASANGFPCSARLPALTSGAHTLELASFIQDGSLLESARSAPLRVGVTGMTQPAAATDVQRRSGAASADAPPERMTPAEASTIVVEGLDQPIDLAPLPDGRLLIAERSGLIRMVEGGRTLDEPALALPQVRGTALMALAVDPEFARSRFVFAIYTAPSRRGAPTFVLARFREAGNTLGDPIVLLDGIQPSPEPRASLRFGPDRKLYAAFDDGGDERRINDAANFNGKVLRMNGDGTTPTDQPGGSPIAARAGRSPRGLFWHPASGALWVADRSRIGVVAWTPPPDGVAIVGDSLYIGGPAGLMRARMDAGADAVGPVVTVVSGTPVRAVAAGADRTLYFATNRTLRALQREP
jgi:hypothetical protein